MGHDIRAHKFTMSVSAEMIRAFYANIGVDVTQKVDLDDVTLTPEQQKQGAQLYDEMILVDFRRNATDPCNRVLYVALDSDDLYGGCSGKHNTRQFTRGEIKKAMAYIEDLTIDQVPPPDLEWLKHFSGKYLKEAMPDLSDEECERTAQFMKDNGLAGEELTPENFDLEQERSFLATCLGWLELNPKMEGIAISFD